MALTATGSSPNASCVCSSWTSFVPFQCGDLNDSLLATLNKELKRCSESDIVPGAASVLGFFVSPMKLPKD